MTKEYDAKGQLVSETYPDGFKIIYKYDKLGNLIPKTLPSGEKITF